MLRIKTPATTSNLSVGFDALGMSLALYNVFEFSESNEFELIGFQENFQKTNVVQKAYESFCRDNGLNQYLKVKIELIKQEIPIARGLGSSASCIVAGILAANHFNKLNKTLLDCANYASHLEGHPDNAFAVVFGSLVTAFKAGNAYHHANLAVSDKLHFAIMIPDFFGETESLRAELPLKVDLKDAVYHLARMVQLPEAFASGDIELLKLLLTDRLHENYRSSHIPMFEDIKNTALANGIITCVSGSGPSVFFISDKADFSCLESFHKHYKLHQIKLGDAVSVEVLS